MPQVNLASGPHGSFVLDAGTDDETRFEPYPEGRALTLLNQAIWIIQNNIFKKKSECNKYFKLLRADGTSRSFDDVWSDPDIWINFDPRITNGWDASTNAVDGKEITLSQSAFQTRNRWYVAGVLVHELAHTNGAGGPPSKAASTALKFCGLAALYDGAVGVAPRARRDTDERIV